ncbi:MAG: acyl-CoA reductase, partial [Chloroflexota bacterium]|nr:acyl-CoA reductase [Chloroflexota bacterium]
ELYRRTTELPDTYLDASFAALPYALDTKSARDMMENELAIWNRTGSELLNGWVQLPSGVFPGMTPSLAQRLGTQGSNSIKENPATTFIRAMPTRQLHIAAGNAPGIPVISAVRAILTKSAGVVKAPYGTTLPGALLSLALASALPNHPIIQNLSIVYWQGGDESIEHTLFRLNAFDRIIVWGAPEAVASVQSRTLFTKTICFNPRYGISMVGREAFSDDLQAVAFKAATDSMIYNQKACNASLIHYVEGTPEQVNSYANILSKILDQWDTLAPQFVSTFARGQLKRMQRGKYSRAHWHVNSKERDFTSGVIVASDEFDIMDHPMSRLIVVRRVDDLADTLNRLNQSVSTVGIYPEERRLHLRDSIAARGVSSVLPLGQCERMFSGMPNDGMMVLNQLIDWKTA